MMINTTRPMTRIEIKEEAQARILNDGAGAFLYLTEDHIDTVTRRTTAGILESQPDPLELANAQAVMAEMDKQFDRLKKFFLFESFRSTH